MKWDQRYVTEKLRDAVNEKITQMYGQNVPEEPQERLCHEIDSIVKNGWVWHYYFAHLLAGKAKNDGRKSFPGRRVACVGKANERSWSLYGTVLTQRVTPQYRQGPPPSSKCGRICGNGIPGGGMGVEPPRQTRRPHATVRAFQIQFVGV